MTKGPTASRLRLTHIDIPSPTTPCAPAFRLCFLLRAGLASDSLRQLSAVLRISLIMCSLISRIRPNRVRRARLSSASSLRAVRSLSVALHEASLARSYFPLLAGSSAKEGLAPSRSSMLPGAHMPLLRSFPGPQPLRVRSASPGMTTSESSRALAQFTRCRRGPPAVFFGEAPSRFSLFVENFVENFVGPN
jgi:hypothetical protein